MSVAGGRVSQRGVGYPCDVTHSWTEWLTNRHLWKHYLPVTSFVWVKNVTLQRVKQVTGKPRRHVARQFSSVNLCGEDILDLNNLPCRELDVDGRGALYYLLKTFFFNIIHGISFPIHQEEKTAIVETPFTSCKPNQKVGIMNGSLLDRREFANSFWEVFCRVQSYRKITFLKIQRCG